MNLITYCGQGYKVATSEVSKEAFIKTRNSLSNRENTMKAHQGDERAKKALVQYNYNDLLPDGKLAGCCHPSSYFGGDVDCKSREECKVLAERFLAKKEEIGLMELSRSASFGLHYVCRRQKGRTILENQVRVSMITRTEMDTNAHDLARVMFTVTADPDELLYLNDELFTEPMTIEESEREYEVLKAREEQGLEEVPAGAKQKNSHYRPWEDALNQGPLGSETSVPKCDSGSFKGVVKHDTVQGCPKHSPLSFKGIPYSDIIDEWWHLQGGEPQEGERNIKLYQLAFSLRAICDNNEAKLLQIMPTYGLPAQEMRTIVHSACKEPPKGITKELTACITACKKMRGTDDEDEENKGEERSLTKLLNKLPMGLKETLIGVPPNMQMQVLCAILPQAATYADMVEVRYCDGDIQHLGLMAIVYGEQASGKTVCKKAADSWMYEMKQEDAKAREVEDKWRAHNKLRKANEKGMEDPQVCIIEVPITISCSTLLKRQKYARGHALYSFTEEFDTLRKTNGAGSWSAKYDIYRLAFDRGEWGQDYNSDQAESGIVNVAYNFTALGTEGSVKKCFKSDNIENGLSSRMIVAQMPDSSFAKMPRYKQRTEQQEQCIRKAAQLLRSYSGFVDTPRLRKAIEEWVEQKRLEAARDIDHVKDTFRRRAAVIGFRAGVIFYLLAGQKESKACIEFALLMADYVLKEQMKLFGKLLLNQFVVAQNESIRYGCNGKIFDELPDYFTRQQLHAMKPDCSESGFRNIISRWIAEGWIERIDKDHFRKLPPTESASA